jgi:hypothetical protein
MALRQRHFLPLELTMFSNPITSTTLTAPLDTETVRDGYTRACGRPCSEAYAQT